VHGRAELRRFDAEREVRSGRREDVAPMERRGQCRPPVRLVGELVGAHNAAEQIRHREEDPVVRADEHRPVPARDHDGTALRPHAGIDDGQMDGPDGRLGQALREDDRPAANASDPVRDIDHTDVRCRARDHQMTDTDELVRRAVIRGEGDERAQSALTLPISCAAAPSASS
jgi:hypothetical protein